MSTENNKEIVGRWFKQFWAHPWTPEIVDELAAPDILLPYSLHAAAPRLGRCQGVHDRVPRRLPGSEFLGRCRPDRRG